MKHAYEISSILKTQSKVFKKINTFLKENPVLGLPTLNFQYMAEIGSLHQELYADVGGFLLLRNHEMKEGIHS